MVRRKRIIITKCRGWHLMSNGHWIDDKVRCISDRWKTFHSCEGWPTPFGIPEYVNASRLDKRCRHNPNQPTVPFRETWHKPLFSPRMPKTTFVPCQTFYTWARGHGGGKGQTRMIYLDDRRETRSAKTAECNRLREGDSNCFSGGFASLWAVQDNCFVAA